MYFYYHFAFRRIPISQGTNIYAMNFRFPFLAVLYCLYTQCLILKIFAQLPGETSPGIVIGVGESANITCRMNLKMFDGDNSSSLYFTTDDPKHKAKHSNIAIINETTIVYTIQNATEQYTSYTCKSGQYAIANTDVVVGTKPRQVTDFSCQAYDFIYMTCSFTIPTNTVPTTYNLKYVTQNANYVLNCTKLVKDGDRATCNFTLDDGSYKPNFEFYNFRLISNNTLGSLIQNFTINHNTVVKPAISEYRVIDITSHSCTLTWQMERYSSYKLNRLQMEVKVQSPYYENSTVYTCIKCNNRSKFNLQIINLPYAYYQYNITLRIKMRMSTATWSDPYSIVFKTLPTAPETPPTVDVSSFYLNATHLRLFWYPVPEYHRNGSNFHYIMRHTMKNGVALNQSPLHIENPTVAFAWSSIESNEYQIWSSNEKGVSPTSSRIHVPLLSRNYEVRTPLGIRNVYHALDRSYTLLWSAPEDYTNLENYTVFWCKPKSVVSNECLNIIGFVHLSKEARNFTIQQSQPLVLAIAANYPDYYTGMHWAKCTADASNDLEKLEPEIIEKKANSITVRWSSGNVCASLIKGYTLVYCKAKYTTKLRCLDKKIKINIDKGDNKYEMINLEPNSLYKMEMNMYSDVQSGPVSNALALQTSETASAPPQNLTFEHITSQSVSLTWSTPDKTNGKIRSYIIIFNGESHVLKCNTNDFRCSSEGKKKERLRYTLANLRSFTNYTICVKAYTVAESPLSNCVNIQSLIGVPSSPSRPKFNDSGNIVIQWQQPEVPSGRVDYYEVIVETKIRDNLEEQHISRITNGGMKCTIKKPRCESSDYIYTISVRAVNIAYTNEIDPNLMHISTNNDQNYQTTPNDELNCMEADDIKYLNNNFIEYHSVEVNVYNCRCGLISTANGRIWLTMFVVIVGISVIVLGSLFIIKRCHEMASINCKIPDPINDLVNRNEINAKEHDKCLKSIHKQQNNLNCENGRLLPSISNDTDYMKFNGIDEHSPSSTINSDYFATNSDFITDYCLQDPMTMSCNQQLPENKNDTTTGYMVMQTPKNKLNNIENNDSVNYMLNYTKMNNGYVRPKVVQLNESNKPFTINWSMEEENDGECYTNPNKGSIFNWQQQQKADMKDTSYLPTVT